MSSSPRAGSIKHPAHADTRESYLGLQAASSPRWLLFCRNGNTLDTVGNSKAWGGEKKPNTQCAN